MAAKKTSKNLTGTKAVEKSGTDCFNRLVELKGSSVFVSNVETPHDTPEQAQTAFKEALEKAVW